MRSILGAPSATVQVPIPTASLYLPVPPIHSIGPLSGSSKSFDPFPVFTMLMRSAEEFAPAGPIDRGRAADGVRREFG